MSYLDGHEPRGHGPMAFVFVDLETWRAYHRERRAINQRYPACDEPPEGTSMHDHWSALAGLRASARAELLLAMRRVAAMTSDGTYPIAV